MDPRHAILFEPVQIGPKTLPNRFYQVPHASGFGGRKPRTHAAFRGIKAEGGWGGVNVDYAPVSHRRRRDPGGRLRRLGARPTSTPSAWSSTPSMRTGRSPASSSTTAARARRTASRATTASRRARSVRRGCTRAAKEMTVVDIRRVQEDFVLAARRARDVGFDIVYVYGAHGYLMTQFLSPLTNRRTDGYGGIAGEPRTVPARDARAGARRGRRRTARSRSGWRRTAATSWSASTSTRCSSSSRIIDPLVDLFDVNVGALAGGLRHLALLRGGLASGPGRRASARPPPSRSWASGATPTPTDGRGDPQRRRRPHRCRPAGDRRPVPAARRSARADSTRSASAPGRTSASCARRPSAMSAASRTPRPARSTAAAGTPSGSSRPVDPARSILVVGGGPAGMECAMVLGRRGFDAVHLVEAEPELGGKLRWTRRLPTLGDWGRVVDHRVIGLDRAATTSRSSSAGGSTAADVLDYGADTVVVATGSTRGDGDGSQPHRVERIAGGETRAHARAGDGRERPPAGPRRRLRHRRLLRRPPASPSCWQVRATSRTS